MVNFHRGQVLNGALSQSVFHPIKNPMDHQSHYYSHFMDRKNETQKTESDHMSRSKHVYHYTPLLAALPSEATLRV